MASYVGTGITADRFIIATLELIAEEGGSQDVNLRQIARRVGCAHTNVYNYFDSYDDLLWAAFRRALRDYGEFLTHDLDGALPPNEYLRRVIANLATYPSRNQGVYRFIGSDPIDLDRIPVDILESVTAMKVWLFKVVEVVVSPEGDSSDAERIANIVLAYIDGETLNLINGRVVPGEDIEERVIENALSLIEALAAPAVPRGRSSQGTQSGWAYPTLDLSGVEEGS